MEKRIFVLSHDTARQRATDAVRSAPDGAQVVIQDLSRTLQQNAIFHALCSDIAKSQEPWAGKPRKAYEWKVLLVSGHAVATNRKAEIVPGIEGEFVNIRESTSSMSISRGSSLIEYTLAFCAQRGIKIRRV